MAGQTSTCFLLLLALNLSLVFCYDDILNYHPRSLTNLYKTSEGGVSGTEAAVFSTSDSGDRENKIDEQVIGRPVIQNDREEAVDNNEDKKNERIIGHSVIQNINGEGADNNGDKKDELVIGNSVIQSSHYKSPEALTDTYNSADEEKVEAMARIIGIVATLLYVGIALLIIFCCPCASCRGKRTPGYVLSESTTGLTAM